MADDARVWLEQSTVRSIIHDLNTEIFLIRGYLDFLREEIETVSPVADQRLRGLYERTETLELLAKRLREAGQVEG